MVISKHMNASSWDPQVFLFSIYVYFVFCASNAIFDLKNLHFSIKFPKCFKQSVFLVQANRFFLKKLKFEKSVFYPTSGYAFAVCCLCRHRPPLPPPPFTVCRRCRHRPPPPPQPPPPPSLAACCWRYPPSLPPQCTTLPNFEKI